jgi:hypothetical protein
MVAVIPGEAPGGRENHSTSMAEQRTGAATMSADHDRDTFVTHDLDGGPQLPRDVERRNPWPTVVSKLRTWSALGAHQSMLYYNI